ncbi:hypothetical protein ACP70R_012027 [Stipagrostis hirtigluma subsp. patula]
MASSATSIVSCCLLLLIFVAPALSGRSLAGPLRYDFYSSSCPRAEEVIRSVTQEIILEDNSMRGVFLMLFFYDCFTRGCDASILLTKSESNPKPENHYFKFRGAGVINKVKAAVEAICPGVVSCADIIALTARDSVTISGSFSFNMPTGRRDGLVSQWITTGQVPSTFDHIQSIIDKFAAKGLNTDDLVALFGAHSVGIASCRYFVDHLSGTADPTFNATYTAELRKLCNAGWYTVVNHNPMDPNHLSNQYYKNVQSGNTLFTSDQALLNNSATAAKVAYFAANPTAWMAHFAGSLVKMGSIQVLTGSAGEIRKFCNVTNSGT